MGLTEKGTVESFIVEELQKIGWTYLGTDELKSRRKEGLEEVLVTEDLRRSIRRINNGIEFSEADLDFIILRLRTLPLNIEGISRFLDFLRNGLVVPIQKENQERVVRLLDFENVENNEFVVTNQYKVEGLKGSIRADVVLLVNGIPLVLVECKSPIREEVSWYNAYTDIKEYEDKVPDLFKYVQFSIATDWTKTYYFPNGFNEEDQDFLSIWKDPYPFERGQFTEDTLRTTIYGLLSKSNLLNVLNNYIFIRVEKDKATKIMARYMQYRAADKICKRVIDTLQSKQQKKFGLVWHWQGSGKTYTMAFTAWTLLHSPEAENPSIFVMVDRKKLESQIENDFAFLDIPIERVETIDQLEEYLEWGKEGKRGIFLVTIEKFSPKKFIKSKRGTKKNKTKIELQRQNIIVLADEVHRTHYGKFRTVMKGIFKKACIFGFTGTPLSKIERNTFQKFCPEKELYLDRYSMLDALDDGFTVPLSYQAWIPDYYLKKDEMKQFLKFEAAEIKTLSSAEQRELRRKVRVIKEFIKKDGRIKVITEELAKHFRDVVEPTELKSMIVTIDREACVKYKLALDKVLPSNYSEIVMTFSSKEKVKRIRDYRNNLQQKYGTTDYRAIHDRIIEDFKTKKQPKILIVTDMLITGFDAPILWTMYMDKPLREHRILQAIARTNRPFPNKEFGLIVDYIGVLKDLQEAFQKFEASDAHALKVVIRNLQKEVERFVKLLQEAMSLFKNVKFEDKPETIDQALNILINPEIATKFEQLMRNLMRSYEMLKGQPELWDYLTNYSILTKLYVYYNKKFKRKNIDELKIEKLSKKTVKLIQETLSTEEINKKFPKVEVDDKYIKLLKRSAPRTQGGAIDITTIVIEETKKHPTSPFFINLRRDVEKTYEELRTRKIKTRETIDKLLDYSQKIIEWKKEEKEIGKDKYPIFEAMKTILPDLDKQTALTTINTLLKRLEEKELLFNGWQQQRDIRRRIRAEIRLQLLSQFKNHRNKIDDLKEAIYESMEMLS